MVCSRGDVGSWACFSDRPLHVPASPPGAPSEPTSHASARCNLSLEFSPVPYATHDVTVTQAIGDSVPRSIGTLGAAALPRYVQALAMVTAVLLFRDWSRLGLSNQRNF